MGAPHAEAESAHIYLCKHDSYLGSAPQLQAAAARSCHRLYYKRSGVP
jgi:hypothetical protein